MWPWLPPLVAIAIWWPIGSYWASDDFLALHYSRELSNAASDLVGPQYGATDVWLFYRPLITLSFWFDQLVAGPAPWFSHVSNVVAHGISALLVARILRRLVGDATACLAAICWAMMPGHVGSLAWAVGRVDSHTVVWCLLAVWLCLRASEAEARGERARRWPTVLATALALMSKELAFVLPPLCSWIVFCGAGGALRDRLGRAARLCWPLWVLFALYLPFRLLVLGRFGGYDSAQLDSLAPAAVADGLGKVLVDTASPLRWIGGPATGPAWLFELACGLPVALAALVGAVRRPGAAATLTGAGLIALVPMVAFLPAAENVHNLRYYYLPSIALVGTLALGGRLPLAAIVLAWTWPLVAVRHTQHAADRDSATRHAALLQLDREAAAGPLFVAGLPHTSPDGVAMQLHFGVDRMLAPPFTDHVRPLYPWRPVLRRPDAVRLTAPTARPFDLPEGSTWWFDGASTLQPAPAAPQLAELPVTGDDGGVLDLASERLDPLLRDHEELVASGSDSFGLSFPNVHTPWLRVTMFTSVGYVSCVCRNHAADGAPHGRLDVLRWLAGDNRRGIGPALLGLAGPDVGHALLVPVTLDLVPEFPTLLEGGDVDLARGGFVPSHRATRLLRFRFDRGYPAWVRRADGNG